MDILKLFEEKECVNICAPMVRYSKLQFRSLVRMYNCDLCFTPMIMADSFVASERARNNELTTNASDNPLIVQFAATNAMDFANAAELVAPYSNGVDLNCGCPQGWALKMGIGAQMLTDPENIKDIVKTTRTRVRSGYSVSVKMRLRSNLKASVSLCQQLEEAGVDFLTVHGRTKDQKSEPVDLEAIKTIASSVTIPIVANGDVKSMNDVEEVHMKTGCKGVMSARGLLTNPALFTGCSKTPKECVSDWITIALSCNLYFITFHHHLVFMLEKILSRQHRRIFNKLTTYPAVLDFLNDYYQFDFKYDATENNCKSVIWEASDEGRNKFFLEKAEPELQLNDLFG